jgi:hypothetical protein
MKRIVKCAVLILVFAAGPWATTARAQSSRKDDVVFNTRGQPLAGAKVRVCTANATTTAPCTPLALIYSDPALTQVLANPLTTDGLGNYTFYAAPGRYVIEISGPGITTRQMRDVILPSDPTAPVTGGDISAFSLTLTGNLTVAGSTAVTGTLTVGGAPVPSVNQANTWTARQQFNATTAFKGPSPWRDIAAFGAVCDGTTDIAPALSAALAAASADPGGVVYIPQCGALISGLAGWKLSGNVTWPSHNYYLNVIQDGNIIIPAGGHSLVDNVTLTNLTWTNGPGIGAGFPGSFSLRSKPAIVMFANAPIIKCKQCSQVRIEGLYFYSGATSANGVEFTSQSDGGFTYIGLINDDFTMSTVGGTGIPLLMDCGPAQAGGNGCFELTIIGGSFEARPTATRAATIAIIGPAGEINIGSPDYKMTLKTFGIYIEDNGSTAGSGLARIQNILTEGTDGAVVHLHTTTNTGSINSVAIERVDIADCLGTCYMVKGTNAALGNIVGVSVRNSSGGGLLDPSSNRVFGLIAENNFELGNPVSAYISTGTDVVINEANFHYMSNSVVTHPALGTHGSIVVNIDPTNQLTDAALHVVDGTTGSAGIVVSSTPAGTTLRVDSAAPTTYATIESLDSSGGALWFVSPTHGSGGIYFDHSTGQKSISFLTGISNQHFKLYENAVGNQAAGSARLYGDLHIDASTTDGIRLYGAPTAFRQQFLQDATGTIALTSQLPASLTNAAHKWFNSYDASTGVFTQTQPDYSDLTGTPAPILSGTTSSIGGSSLAAGACVDGTASVTSSTASMAVAVSPAADPGTGFTWNAWVSAAGTVTVRVCNVSGASATPTASAYNVRVIQ